MVERIVCFVACLMCAVPFLIIARYDRNSSEPVGFWSGDKTLKSKVKNVPAYNKEMAALYGRCAAAFLFAGAGCMVTVSFGIALIVLECTVGIYLVWRSYKKILKKYS